MVGLPSAARATVGSPATGATGSPVAFASGVRTVLASITKSSVSLFFTLELLSRLARPSFGAMATSTRPPSLVPTRLRTSWVAVLVLSSVIVPGVAPHDVSSSLPVRPSTSM